MKPHPLFLSFFLLFAAILDSPAQAQAQAQAQTAVPPTPAQDKKEKPRADAPPPEITGTTVTWNTGNGKAATVGIDRDGSVLLSLYPATLETMVKQLET